MASELKILVDQEILNLGFFSPIASGEANTGANVGGGAEIYRDKTGAVLNMRTLVGSGDIVVSEVGDTVEVAHVDAGGDVTGPAGATDEAVAVFDGATGKLIKGSGAAVDASGNITTPGTIDGRDVSADGAALDAHVASSANPHATDVGNLGVGTLAELNAAITDANVDDDGDPRDPTSHASSHADGGADEVSVEDLATAGALGEVPASDGVGGLAMAPKGIVVDANYDEATAAATTSAALTDIAGLSFTVDVPTGQTARIYADMSFQGSTTGGAPSTGAWAVSVNAVDGTELKRYLSGTNDTGIGGVKTRSAVLGAGAYTVKGRFRRVSGGSTINTDVAQLSAFVALE